MTSTTSVSDPAKLLHREVLRWVHSQGWKQLHPVQLLALQPVSGALEDVIISAPTAGGKTEAAFLPICSRLLHDQAGGSPPPGIRVLCISPLKALINDQYDRLELLCGSLEIPVHRWHGDVPASAKARLRRDPSGIVLITPESVEALFVTLGPDTERLLSGLRYLVVDELHSFIGTERGAQLQSLLHRAEQVVSRQVPRVGLSATLSDQLVAAEFLRPGHGEQVHYIAPPADARYEVQVFGHQRRAPEPSDESDDEPLDLESISEHLFSSFRGRHHLVFTNSRSDVEVMADRLAGMCDDRRVPQEFFAHHGNLSRDHREFVEQRLKTSTPTTAVCTATLEMGIDIGRVHSVAQLGAPPGVASLRQRMGRSGRTNGVPILDLHIAEPALSSDSKLIDQLRIELVQTVAMLELMEAGWLESPDVGDLHLSTLTQQVLSVIAQHGGASARALYKLLCAEGPFRRVTSADFVALLRSLGAARLLTQGGDGLLLPGELGDRIINHYSFYTAFHTPEEFRVAVRSRTLGTLPMDRPIRPGGLLIFAGRRWRIVEVDTDQKVILVEPCSGGRAPKFQGSGPAVADEVRRRMRAVYLSDRIPSWLDDEAQTLLEQGRATFRRRELATVTCFDDGRDTTILPWRGDKIMNTMCAVLTANGLDAGRSGVALIIQDQRAKSVRHALGELAAAPVEDAVTIASTIAFKQRDKYDAYLSDELLTLAYASRDLDLPNAWQVLRDIAESADQAPLASPVTTTAASARPQLGRTPFAVLDIETTGLDPHQDRIVELAIVEVSPEGKIVGTWDTMLNPDRHPGPIGLHGLTARELSTAPRFTDIADDVITRLNGAIVVAHNADFDLRFLSAEYQRLGRQPPVWPSLCTLRTAYRLGRAGSRRLSDLCAGEGLRHAHAHSALGDADATARLLGVYLRRAQASGLDLEDLGVDPHQLQSARTGHIGSGKRVPRAQPTALRQLGAAPASGDPRIDGYLDLLDTVLADHIITAAELASLRTHALDHACSPRLLAAAHDRYVQELREVPDLAAQIDDIERALRAVTHV